ncbi:GNAT family N-acetyltransferase [Lottiidibacillus patelloidae]|uniref:GNAT family N-acetyltransferase n=1 Tax=Lottiidibacillus patelloidae TaxID=2670334 RepID=A0A263BUC2_9BACI|nr:GNAT family N-acetyltransferase [Lottiidibacillus patelloidae]OZM56776.1 GNAT family N-acetyltransferase [Lottiidibacillus patelloidae]
MKINETKDYKIIGMLNKHVHTIHANLAPELVKPYDKENMTEFFKDVITKDKMTFLLVEEDDEPIGYAWIEEKEYAENIFKKGYKSLYVHQISINDKKRSSGYGTKLMEEIYQIARSKGLKRIELDYWSDNEKAKKFYEKQGFEKHREFVYKNIEE